MLGFERWSSGPQKEKMRVISKKMPGKAQLFQKESNPRLLSHEPETLVTETPILDV